jgi:hypothetical protein
MDQRTPTFALRALISPRLFELTGVFGAWELARSVEEDAWTRPIWPAVGLETYMSRPRTAEIEKAIEARTSRWRRRAGVVVVEYAFLLVFFGIPVIIGTTFLGIKMIKGYGEIRNDQLHVGP